MLVISLTAVYVTQVYYKQRDYWPFVWCVRYVSPHLASHVEQVRSNRLIWLDVRLDEIRAKRNRFMKDLHFVSYTVLYLCVNLTVMVI